VWLQSLNETFYSVWAPDITEFSDYLSVNADIFSQFNTSLAYNPLTQVWPISHAHLKRVMGKPSPFCQCCGQVSMLLYACDSSRRTT
jgi:hypothetical protein